ncbi:hypothetical protein N7509_012560 [Penicillium cosmopolitanum]|uniref:DNA polymerase epsilon subunit D n=1 Tax=Penicillium cosmopolitanum TaxID=1131564 RepID=A0A9W9SIX2_9EURO|nr:uncharacterized protein N7509_012560 [Penicillium cosmopolitanum]KAJ5379441.1 hypothetical protein N7509_012560 [Penicillium cosmopolitanum]
MPPRKSTSSVTPADPDESIQLSPQAQTSSDKPITATEQQLKARAEAGVSVEDYLLPRSLTIRLAKSVLPPNTTIQKDAVLAIQKAATVFVSYLSSHANESTLKRTVAPADVFAALSELEFDSFRTRLEAELEAYTDIKAGKRKAKKPEEGDTASAGAGAGAAAGTGSSAAARDEDDDVEMTDNPAKRVKRDSEGKNGGDVDGDETQDEEEHEHEDEEEEEEEEDEDEEDGEEEKGHEEDIDRVEDLDGERRHVDPDDEESEDDDGPGSQLHNDLGLG